jgi:hypothetical protein
MEIWEPISPGTLWATPDLLGDSFLGKWKLLVVIGMVWTLFVKVAYLCIYADVYAYLQLYDNTVYVLCTAEKFKSILMYPFLVKWTKRLFNLVCSLQLRYFQGVKMSLGNPISTFPAGN